jgi:hypothetical protein
MPVQRGQGTQARRKRNYGPVPFKGFIQTDFPWVVVIGGFKASRQKCLKRWFLQPIRTVSTGGDI